MSTSDEHIEELDNHPAAEVSDEDPASDSADAAVVGRDMGTSRLPDPGGFDFSGREMGDSRLPDAAGFDFAAIDTPEELVTPQTPVLEASALPPPIDRPRAQREPLLRRRVWLTALGVLAGIAVVVLVAFLVIRMSRIQVPDVTGIPYGEARVRLAQIGLEATVAEQRFSAESAETVLSQDPAAGDAIAKGATVGLVISAGTEEFSMPDVVGDGLALARGVLEERGLAVRVESITSDVTSDTVLSTIPAAGAVVRSGDVVRVQIAASAGSEATLKRYDLSGLSILIDPGDPVTGRDDIGLDVARRVRSLLEASGATVTMLRSNDGEATSEALRAQRAVTASATAGVGFGLRTGGTAGRVVTGEGSATSASAPEFTGIMLVEVKKAALPAEAGAKTTDAVFGPAGYPWSRVVLGTWAAPEDDAAFNDPRWADGIARAVYTALGKAFGTRSSQ